MSEDLFEKYFQNTLTSDEAEALKAILRVEGEGRQAFVRYMQERSILINLTGKKSEEGELPVLPSKSGRRRVPANRRSPWTGLAIAAAILFAFILGLLIVPSNPIPAPSAKNESSPLGAPQRKLEPPAPEATKPELVRIPTPIPTPPKDNNKPEVNLVQPEPSRPVVAKKPAPEPPKPAPEKPAPKTIPACVLVSFASKPIKTQSNKPHLNRK